MIGTDTKDYLGVDLTLTADDFANAYQARFTPTRRELRIATVLVLGMCCAGVLVLRSCGAPVWIQTFVPFLAVLCGVLGGYAQWRFFLPWLGRRIYAKQPISHQRICMTFRPEGLEVQSERGQSIFLWKDFTAWRANGKTTVLYLSPYLFLHVPSRISAKGFPIDDLRSALAREIGPAKT